MCRLPVGVGKFSVLCPLHFYVFEICISSAFSFKAKTSGGKFISLYIMVHFRLNSRQFPLNIMKGKKKKTIGKRD